MVKRISLVGMIILATSLPVAQADEPQYMAIFMDDVKVGHAVSQRKVVGGEVTHTQTMALTISRGAASIAVTVSTAMTETTAGAPLRFTYEANLGGLGGMKKNGVIKNGQMTVTIDQFGMPAEQTMPYPEGALMPEAATKLMKAKGAKPGTKYTCITFDPESLGGLKTDTVVGEPRLVPLIGEATAKLTPMALTVHHQGNPLSMRVFVDETFEARKMEMGLMGIKLVLVGCSKGYANSPNGRFDALKAGTVASPTSIANARELRSATYTLAPTTKGARLALPTTDSQTVRVGSDGVLTVQMRTLNLPEAPRPYRGKDAAALAALKPGQYVESNDAGIRARAAKLTAGTTDAAEATRAIVSWVRAHITTKDLSVGYASAASTLQSRKGDCTEHSVLTAALCRAAGIPCRIVAGIAYTPAFGELTNCFAGHQWNQVYLAGKWIDVDAALGADAARITLVVNAEDQMDFIAMANSLGSFKVTRIQTGK